MKSYSVISNLIGLFLEYLLDTEIITCALGKYRRKMLVHPSKEYLPLGNQNVFK